MVLKSLVRHSHLHTPSCILFACVSIGVCRCSHLCRPEVEIYLHLSFSTFELFFFFIFFQKISIVLSNSFYFSFHYFIGHLMKYNLIIFTNPPAPLRYTLLPYPPNFVFSLVWNSLSPTCVARIPWDVCPSTGVWLAFIKSHTFKKQNKQIKTKLTPGLPALSSS